MKKALIISSVFLLFAVTTSPPDSIWDNIQPGDPFEIVYEKGNPANSNWVGYYKK